MLKAQLKQLLKRGYSEIDVRNLAVAPKHLVDQAIAEYNADQKFNQQTLRVQHNQASFAMRLGG
ncbi:hypothetical protein [Neptuniibacter halophilus]|uniref:hypothetical protein n=1 Tax=Neptuniibacter halophilus TaxID=651666 RepID=UPI002572BF7B|nr:hypothetical protein [Neptuniibacter halophilus]